jgi:DNA (cytosine-5)-methyltransferase 1
VLDAAHQGWRRHGRFGEWTDSVDVVFGGPSCQGFSNIGYRAVDDERNGLLAEFVRLVFEISPRAFCLENVPGLLNARFADIRNSALNGLRMAGYRFSEEIIPLDAIDYGVPQHRKRVVIVGVRDCSPGDIPPIGAEVRTVQDAFEGLPSPARYPELKKQDAVRLDPHDTARRRSAVGQYARCLSGLEKDLDDKSRERSWNRLLLTNSLVTNHSSEVMKRFEATECGSTESVSRYFRLRLDQPARTLRAGTARERGAFTSPRPIHPTEPRTITVREAARLHSYPDWFRFNGTNWHGHRQIGNSVPPLLARAVGILMAKSLGHAPVRGWRTAEPQDTALLRMTISGATEVVSSELPSNRVRSGIQRLEDLESASS